jgi:aryl-alcohol dehydrogenase-like predicted oxidoreductase
MPQISRSSSASLISGFATPAGASRFAQRFPALQAAGHFRHAAGVPQVSELALPSLGLGTYLGDTGPAADGGYVAAIHAALTSGINLLDTAINYRHQQSERNIGAALSQLISAGQLQRDEVLICTKAGFLPLDGEMPDDPRGYFLVEYIETGIARPEEIAGGMHCMAPAYLEDQLERSRKNLGLETIDVFYLHNPETQLSCGVEQEVFLRRLQAAFTTLEGAVADGKLRFYGCATWNAFRLPHGHSEAIQLSDLLELARQVAGPDHHFRFIQLPFNLGMVEAYGLRNQSRLAAINSGEDQMLTVLEMAAEAGVAAVGSATLVQGKLTRGLPESVRQILGSNSAAKNATNSDAETAIQFARSAPGLVTALVGMGRSQHVAENIAALHQQPVPFGQWARLFQR